MIMRRMPTRPNAGSWSSTRDDDMAASVATSHYGGLRGSRATTTRNWATGQSTNEWGATTRMLSWSLSAELLRYTASWSSRIGPRIDPLRVL